MARFPKIFAAVARLCRQNMLIIGLIGASVFCLFLLALRLALSHNSTYSLMSRNLFLAWPPLASAFFAYKYHKKPAVVFRVTTALCVVLWLVFLPNAPYLVTDLVHFSPRYDMSLWFDLIMFVAYAVTGLLYGSISIYWMQQLVRKMAGAAAGWLFVCGVSALSSFGIYLGRFQRWNSWDVISHPIGLLTDIWQNVRHPLSHFQTFAFSTLFTLFLMSVYLIVTALTHLSEENR